MSEPETPQQDDSPDQGVSSGQEPRATGLYQKALQEELSELVDVVGPGPLVDIMLERAFQLDATDIHLDPTDDGLRVRLRVDGIMHEVLKLPASKTSNIVSRIKLMGGMDINQRRNVQDGRISNSVLSVQRDIRIGAVPTIYGERLVMRLMPDDTKLHKIEHLGLDESQAETIERFLDAPYGMVLAAGPVGSGKTTTLYGCLEKLNHPNVSIVTIEDPVERRIDGLNQIQVEPRHDFTFVHALRGVLRQDPNILMVGEIRDQETAHIAIRAALTGVIALTTIHANDTAGTIDVFREFDIPPMFIADSLQGVIAQRLIRKVCTECKVEYQPDETTCQLLGIDPAAASSYSLARGEGCSKCFQTGHSGRTGIFEVMPIEGEVRKGIIKGVPHSELTQLAQDQGMMTLADAARQKILEGICSMQEYHRVLSFSSH